jgi:hypothetical protein
MKIWKWLKHRVKHKLQHFQPSTVKKLLKEYGVAFLVIFIIWEIIEDVMFPLLFVWLGKNVDPWFLSGAPISWLLCVHPIAVPIIWGAWIKISTKKLDK